MKNYILTMNLQVLNSFKNRKTYKSQSTGCEKKKLNEKFSYLRTLQKKI